MKKIILIALLFSFSILSHAKVKLVSEEELKPNSDHRRTSVVVARVLGRYHYKKVPLDDELSSQIFDRYLEILDPRKFFFTQKDIDELDKRYRYRLDDAIASGWLEPAFDIFKRYRQRVKQRLDYALKLLNEYPFNFNKKETYYFDREEVAWAKDEAEIKEIWRQRVKNDILSLKLNGKDEQEIKKTLTKRYERIKRRVFQLDGDDVVQNFINAYTLTVEPHTAYMSPARSENFDISMRLSLQGIGALLSSEDEYVKIEKIIPGGPADQSNQLHAGDRIIGVAQGEKGEMEDIIGWTLQDVVEKIRGPRGTIVRLLVLPKGSDVPKEITIKRDKIKLEDQAAKADILEIDGKKFGVIEIPAFYRDFQGASLGRKDFRSTTRDVKRLIQELKQKGIDGLIIDLRDNGGGALTEAIELTGLFIPYGPVVQVRDADGEIEVERDTDMGTAYEGPLAVLVNRNSASASEIFAAAIQDYGRGIIIGEPTFGKGTVQSLVDLDQFIYGAGDLGRLRLTMAQFFRIKGDSTQHQGVTPDIVFPTAEGAEDHGERALDNALPSDSIPAARYQKLGSIDIAPLQRKHEQRIKTDPLFQFLIEQNQALNEIQQRKSLSLLESERKQEQEQREAKALQRRNALRKARGLEPLKSLEKEEDKTLEDEEEDPEQVHRIMQEEAAHILADYIQLQQNVRSDITD